MASTVPAMFRKGATALITGGASGIGLETARLCRSHGMNLVLLDINEAALSEVQASFPSDESVKTTTHILDVSSGSAWKDLAPQILQRYPDGIDFLMLNAGAAPKPAAGKTFWEDPESFEKTFATNTFGYTNGLAAFLGSVTKEKNAPRAVVLTGSKQGITNPPGNPAYNASKAAVRTIAEHLSFDLSTAAPNVSVHLLVPGWTFTGLTSSRSAEKPAGAWAPEQVAEFMAKKIAENAFYVLCPDNDVTEDLDKKRILWTANDIVQGRPPLTRWRKEWKDKAQSAIENTQL
jgi:NAD(P)-dependent dehydrogenase (short-subunit alcohol dehydrogenase family)